MAADRVRFGGYAGIVFVFAGVAQFFAAPAPPAPDAASAKIRVYLVDHRSGLLAQGFLQILAILFFLLFLVGLHEVLRRSEYREISLVAVIGGVVLAVGVLVAQMVINAPVWVDGAAQLMGNDVLRLVWSASYLLFSGSALGLVLLAGSTAIAGARERLVPAAVTWVSVFVALVGLASLLAQFGSDFGVFGILSFLAVLVFVLVAAAVMVTGRASEPAVAEER